MVQTIKYIISKQFDPYHNLALEEYLLNTVERGTCILFLWQNKSTVVVGKNQNAWKECKVKELEQDGGHLVRRLSGGGAVFHDLGNLNFTFLLHKEDYNVEKQLEVIVLAVSKLGIKAEKSGRNDITVEGKKFSGNAFYTKGKTCYHHGTILVKVDMQNLSTYLNVSKEKLVSKGVDSVKARVTNLTSYKPDLTISQMREKLIESFSEIYGLQAQQMDASACKKEELEQLYMKFASRDWIFGKIIEFQYSISKRFSWGDIDIHLLIKEGIIKECLAYSDSMEVEVFEEIPALFIGCEFTSLKMLEVFDGFIKSHSNVTNILEDIKGLLMQE